jgi:Protein of unknown function (DUF2730)
VTPAEVYVADILVWVVALSTLLSFGTALWTIFSGPSRKNVARLDDHTGRMDRHEARLQSLEQEMRAMPTKEDMHKVQLSLGRLEGQFAVMNERLAPVKAISERMQELLFNQGNNK